MGKARGSGEPYKEIRKDRKGREVVYWCFKCELDRKPNGDRDYTVIRRRNRNELIKAKNELLVKLASGEPIKVDKRKVCEWLEFWLPNYAKPRMKPRPYRNYVSIVNCHIIPHIGNVQLAKVKAEHIRAIHRGVKQSGAGVRMAEQAQSVLSLAIRDAIIEEVLPQNTRNIAELVEKPKDRTRASREPLEVEEARAVLRKSRERNDPMFARWLMALLLGSRQGECLGLTWDRVNFEEETLDLSWELQWLPLKRKKGDPLPVEEVYPREMFDVADGEEFIPLYRSSALIRPKTDESTRVVPIPAPLLVELKRLKESSPPNPWNLVWVSEKGVPIRSRDDTEAWKDASAAAEVPIYVLHAGGRHTANNLLLELGVSEEIRMAIMGQSSVAANRIYTKVKLAEKRKAITELSEWLVAA
ncbi:tyrosine-type recombinase/integrase [Nocardia terpenica]|uniref:Tyrosine-type recombinase/integrase n=1 Tax=Nocardia terpenica TaxID=455432 RepID=A0A6G9Z0Q0_9NOCA|nr:site-specific integrase [Nocardia terpenica]QIS18583.1 tyrosine-type recombinase/integrase [Nocardia terpenica]